MADTAGKDQREREYVDIPVPELELVVKETGWALWNSLFKRHHYLSDAGPMGFSTAYTGFIDEQPICFLGVSGCVTGRGRREARACRLVVLPEWNGAGVGIRFLEWACDRELKGEGFIGKETTTMFHTAHPALCVVLRRSPKWRQVSQALHGGTRRDNSPTGMGGHMRAVVGFRYYGQAGADAYTGAIRPGRNRL